MTRPSLITRNFTIPGNGSIETIRDAEFLTCLAATHPFQISFDNAPRVDFESGITLNVPDRFRRVEFINPIADELVIRITMGRGDFQDNRAAFSGDFSVINGGADLIVRQAVPDIVTDPAWISCATGVATQIAAANANRTEVIVNNPGGSEVWVKTANTATARGVLIAARSTAFLAVKGALHLFQESGATISVNVSEIEFAS